MQVGETNDDDGDPDEDDGEDDGVVVVGHAVPDALQTLVVEGVVAHARQVEEDEKEADSVDGGTHGDAVSQREEAGVQGGPADEHVAVKAHGRQRHQRPHARDGAQAAHRTTQVGDRVEPTPSHSLG